MSGGAIACLICHQPVEWPMYVRLQSPLIFWEAQRPALVGDPICRACWPAIEATYAQLFTQLMEER